MRLTDDRLSLREAIDNARIRMPPRMRPPS